MNSNDDGKPEPIDPEKAERLLELELLRQRAALKDVGTRYKGLRAASLFFFVAVVLAALFAFFYLFQSGRLDELRAQASPPPSPVSVEASPAP